MHPLRRRLSSLNHLFAVDAVGRHLSFTVAADELGISQPAVSKAIRVTEESIGFEIFERLHRGLKLTQKGKTFFEETRSVLKQLSDVLGELAPLEERFEVRASFSSSFVAMWMLPRLSQFSKRNPDIALHLEESDSDMINLVSKGMDFSARLGDGNWDDVKVTKLVAERVGAVASPSYLDSHPELSDPKSLLTADLIHVDEPKRVRVGWRDWFAHFGVKPPYPKASFTVSDNHSAIDAAAIGQGVALGWEHLVSGKIAEGKLVWIGDSHFETGMSIFLVEPLEASKAQHLSRFRSWILEQFSDH